MEWPFTISRILAPTDLTDATVPALRFATMFADRFNANLTLLYSDPIVLPIEMAGSLQPAHFTSSPQHEAKLRDEVRRHAQRVLHRDYDVRITLGQPVEMIVAAAKELNSDLIVVGRHLHHGFERVLLGSVSEGVLYRSHCPVLIVSSDDKSLSDHVQTLKTILCPINFTDVSADSVRVAARLAQKFGANLIVVHVIEEGDLSERFADEARVRNWIEPVVAGTCAYRDIVLRGNAGERVLDCAEEVNAGLIVVGTQHRLLRNQTVIGATSDRLIRFAPCPIVAVPRQTVVAKKTRSNAAPPAARW